MAQGAPAPKGGTLAQQYRDRMSRELTLKSGATVRAKRGSILDFIYSGAVPAPLLDVVGGVAEAPTPDSIERQKAIKEGMNIIVKHFVEEPKIVLRSEAIARLRADEEKREVPISGDSVDDRLFAPYLSEDELGAWEMPDSDKVELYQIALRDAGLAAESAAPFPPVPGERRRGDGATPPGERVRSETVEPDLGRGDGHGPAVSIRPGGGGDRDPGTDAAPRADAAGAGAEPERAPVEA